MSLIHIVRWEKTTTACPQCDNMRRHVDKWLEVNGDDHEVVITNESAEDDRDYLIDIGATTAPVYMVERDGVETTVMGNNPDILLDALDGQEEIWEDCSI